MKKKRLIVIGVLGIILVSGVFLFLNSQNASPEFFNRAICGDGFCEYPESSNSCPQDCRGGGYMCPDGFCDINSGENINNCPRDCGGVPQEYCGDGICQESRGESKYECPIDCGLPLPICGDGICQVFHYSPNLPPYSNDIVDEFIVCPQDCGGSGEPNPIDLNNEEIIYSLNQKQRPLVGGLSIEMPRGDNFALCTLGAIIKKGGTKYILTAGHCVTDGEDGFPDPDDIGLQIKQGGEIIGRVYKTDFTGGIDVALISINYRISSKQETFLGDEVLEMGSNSEVYIGKKVFKIGRTTGLTYGTITDWVGYTGSDGIMWDGYKVTGDNGKFSTSGDSGSAIITVSKPHKIVGIISAGDGSNMPEDIKNELGLS